jgi:CheY-like chemotaxis protein
MNRNPTFTPVAILPATDGDRGRHAWLASKREELLAPAGALLDLSAMVLSDASDCGHAELLHDLQQVHAAASNLLAMIHEILDPAASAVDETELAQRIRHDLRTPLTEIIGLCELRLEDDPEPPLDRFARDLQALVRLGKELVENLNSILDFGKTASDADIDLDGLQGDQAELIRELVHSLPAADVPLTARTAEKGVLLVVEDNPINRDLLVRRLTRDGHSVLEAADGRQGLAVARGHAVDLILLDVIMPGLNGLQLLQKLKADPDLRHVPVIMISAFSELDGVVRCLEMGAEDYLAKPFNPVLLRARIEGCLEKKRLRSRDARARAGAAPQRYDLAAVLCCDVAGFSPAGDQLRSIEAVHRLQELMEVFEGIAPRHRVEKIRTAAATFLAGAGLGPGDSEAVAACLRCGLDLIAACAGLPAGWEARVGIEAGPVVAAAVGRQQPTFDLFGEAVSVAAALASQGAPRTVTLGASAWRRVSHLCRGQPCESVPVPGMASTERFRFDGFLT